MDVSTPFADVKQISVQNKPLGGKVIKLSSIYMKIHICPIDGLKLWLIKSTILFIKA